jgi:integrase/recombinase XerD
MTTAERTVADYLRFCRIAQNLSENTVCAYRQDLRDFLKFGGAPLALDHIGSDVVTGYVRDALDRRGLSPATVRRRVACLRGFFRWLSRSGIVTASPFEGIDLPIPLPRRLPKVIDRLELQRILSWVSPAAAMAPGGEARTRARRGPVAGSSAAHQTTYLAILIMLATGVRVGELTGVRIGDVSLAEGAIKIRGKGGRERTVYVCNPQVAGLLERAIQARGGPGAAEAALLVNAPGPAAVGPGHAPAPAPDLRAGGARPPGDAPHVPAHRRHPVDRGRHQPPLRPAPPGPPEHLHHGNLHPRHGHQPEDSSATRESAGEDAVVR